MACYHPIKGYKSKHLSANGKRTIVFNVNDAYRDLPITIQCGQCIGCRLEKSRQWAIRCSHEASLYKNNSFITLTYNDNNLPHNGSLDITHFQKFMKRLRFKYQPKTIRFYHCGEYGEKHRRPHYHACLFNHDFEDKRLFQETKNGKLYTSAILTEIWGMGHASIGAVTFRSAAYVARYIMKKINGEPAEKYYEWTDQVTGEVHKLAPEYTTMSRRPGIGSKWLRQYSADVYPDDFVIIDGKKMRPPRAYDAQYEMESPEQFKRIRQERLKGLRKYKENNTPERLRVREQVQNAKLKQLPRKLE